MTLAFVVQPENSHEALEFQQFWMKEFERLKLPLQQFYDWPSEESDNLYFRRLNCSDQDASDALHADTAFKLGLTKVQHASLKQAGSF